MKAGYTIDSRIGDPKHTKRHLKNGNITGVIIDNYHGLNEVCFWYDWTGVSDMRSDSTVAIFRIRLKSHLQINSDGQLTGTP